MPSADRGNFHTPRGCHRRHVTAPPRIRQSRYVSKKTIQRYGDDCIKVVVGKGLKQEAFAIHAAHITARSQFFKDATAGSSIYLPEDDADIFAVYVHFLYTGTLAVVDETAESGNPSVQYRTLAETYVLAEKLDDTRAKNAFLNALIEETDKTRTGGSSHFPDSQTVAVIYDGTLSESPARKLLVDLYTYNDESYSPKAAETEDWPVEFLRDLSIRLDELGNDWTPDTEFQSPKRNIEKYLEDEKKLDN